MSQFFYEILFRVGSNKICSLWNKVVGKILNWVFPVYCKLTPNARGINKTFRETTLIVSLTSFPARFDKLHLCVEALLRQSYRPDKILLWLCTEECDKVDLPKSLLKLKGFGLEIRFVSESLKPHNKYIYCAKEFNDCIIVTVDDDIIYSSNMLQDLINAYKLHPDCIICNMAHTITLDEKGSPNPYDMWRGGAIGQTGPSYFLTALGVGGVLYPPHFFTNVYLNAELIKSLSLSNDDLWLKYNEVVQGYKVYKTKVNAKNPIQIPTTQKTALTHLNNGTGKNDFIIKKLNNYFNISWMDLVNKEGI